MIYYDFSWFCGMIGLSWVVLTWVFHKVAVRCWLHSSQGSPGPDVHNGSLTWLAVMLIVAWETSWSCQTECLHVASTRALGFGQHSGWVIKGSSLWASIPRQRSCKSLGTETGTLLLLLFSIGRSSHRAANIQWEDTDFTYRWGVAKYLWVTLIHIVPQYLEWHLCAILVATHKIKWPKAKKLNIQYSLLGDD